MSEDVGVIESEPMATVAAEHATSDVSLLVDVGTAWTKASVIGRARGRWRVVSHAAQPTAWGEASLIASLTDRLAPSADQRVRDDLDAILAGAPRIACHTPARPGRIAIAAVTAEISGSAARRAAESAGWIVVELAAADDGRPLPERLAALAGADVDAWLVAGGFDAAHPEQAREAAGIVAAARGGGRSPVLWAGSASLAGEIEALFEPGVVTAVANPHPTAGEESLAGLRRHLEELLDRMVESGGTRNLAPIGFRRSIAEIATEEGLHVGGVDLGARYATWVLADGRSDPVAAESRVFAAGGLGSPALGAPGAIARIARLLAIPIDELAVADTLQNMRSRPGTLPYGDEELEVTRAAAQLLLSTLAEERGTDAIDLLIGSGRVIAAAPSPMHAMQLLLDGLRPPGVTQLAIDGAGCLAPLGSLADDEIREGIGMLRNDLLTPLGTAVVTRGGRSGQAAMTARLHRTGWPDPQPVLVRTGQLAVLPLPRGERADLELELAPTVTLPAARRAHRVHVEVVGGAVGLVLDARDIPLQLPRRLDDRRAILAGWREQLLREPVAREGSVSRPEPDPGADGGHDRSRRWLSRPPFFRSATAPQDEGEVVIGLQPVGGGGPAPDDDRDGGDVHDPGATEAPR